MRTVVYNNVKVRLYDDCVPVQDVVKVCNNTSFQVYAPKTEGYKVINKVDVDGAGMYGSTTSLGVLPISGLRYIALNSRLRDATKAELRKFIDFLEINKTKESLHHTIVTSLIKDNKDRQEVVDAQQEEIQKLREENANLMKLYNQAMESKERVYTTPDIIKAVEDKLHKAEADVVKYRGILEELRSMQWE